MKTNLIFLVLITLFYAAFFGCKDNPVKPATPPPQDTNQKPQIISFSPDSGYEGSKVIIRGRNIGIDGPEIMVWYGRNISTRKLCKIVGLYYDSIAVELPTNILSDCFVITCKYLSDTSKKNFTVLQISDFYIDVYSPKSKTGCPGETMFIKGKKLLSIKNDLKIMFDHGEVPIDEINDTLIKTRFVMSPGEYNLNYSVRGKEFNNNPQDEKCYKYLVGEFSFYGISEPMAIAGDKVHILSSYFGSGKLPVVKFGSVQAKVISAIDAHYLHHGYDYNLNKMPYDEYIPGSITCIVPQNPDPNITVEATCGVLGYFYDGLVQHKIDSAKIEISNVKVKYKGFNAGKLDSNWTETLLTIPVTRYNKQTNNIVYFQQIDNSSYGTRRDTTSYNLNLTDLTDLTVFQGSYHWNGSYVYSAAGYSHYEFIIKNMRKISEDNSQIIYEIRGSDIFNNLVNLNYWRKGIGGGYYVYEEYSIEYLLDQTPDSYIRIYLQKK